jgi:hypothetical protein
MTPLLHALLFDPDAAVIPQLQTLSSMKMTALMEEVVETGMVPVLHRMETLLTPLFPKHVKKLMVKACLHALDTRQIAVFQSLFERGHPDRFRVDAVFVRALEKGEEAMALLLAGKAIGNQSECVTMMKAAITHQRPLVMQACMAILGRESGVIARLLDQCLREYPAGFGVFTQDLKAYHLSEAGAMAFGDGHPDVTRRVGEFLASSLTPLHRQGLRSMALMVGRRNTDALELFCELLPADLPADVWSHLPARDETDTHIVELMEIFMERRRMESLLPPGQDTGRALRL